MDEFGQTNDSSASARGTLANTSAESDCKRCFRFAHQTTTQNKSPGMNPGLSRNLFRAPSADVLFQPLLDLILRHVADYLFLHLAALEQQQRGNAANAIAHRSRVITVDVHFANLDLARIL